MKTFNIKITQTGSIVFKVKADNFDDAIFNLQDMIGGEIIHDNKVPIAEIKFDTSYTEVKR